MLHQDKTAVELQFDNDSEDYLSKHLNKAKLREKDRILNLLNKEDKFGKLLDIGCGPGTISEDLLGISEKVWGIDISEEMIKVARKRFKDSPNNSQIFFDKGNAEDLQFPDQFFDAVVCLGVLRYLDSWERSLNEIYRVLKPDGIIITTFYHLFSPYWFTLIFLYRPLLPMISIIKGRTYKDLILKYKAEPLPFSYLKFKKYFRETGFKQSVTLHSGFEIWPINKIFPGLSGKLNLKAESVLFDSTFLGWLGCICLVMGKK